MSRKFLRTALLGLWIAVLHCAGLPAAHAAGVEWSEYERDSVKEAIKRVGGEIDPQPEDKIVASVEVVTLQVIEDRDPAPNLLNALHATTRDSIIRREVLLGPGSPYRQTLADETARNLRSLPQMSVVLLVALRGPTPNSVRLLVVTKDVWSLRLGWDFAFYNGKFTYLFLQPSETNILGTTQVVAANVQLNARNYSFGASYLAPRIDGSRIQALISGGLTMNCGSGKVEGGNGYLRYGQPLYSTETEWSWGTAVSFNDSIVRPLPDAGSAICSAPPELTTPVIVERRRSPATDATLTHEVMVPYRYRSEVLRGQFALTRSLYRVNKLNISFGAEVDRRIRSAVPTNESEVFERETRYKKTADGWRQAQEPTPIPVQTEDRNFALDRWEALQAKTRDTRVSPYLQLHSFANRYLSTINYATLGLQEDIALGHDVYLRLYPAFQPLSTRNMLGLFTSASYTIPLQTGFFRVLAAGTFEFAGAGRQDATGYYSGISQSRSKVQLWAQLASPDTGLGRFVSNLAVVRRALNYQDTIFSLGGSNQLRGFKPNSFTGNEIFILNTEFRTRPVQLFSIQAGLDIFYDVGGVDNSLHTMKFKHGGGVGFRFLLPQLDRDAFRVDFGFPFQSDANGEFTFIAGFKQVFGTPVVTPEALLAQ